MIKIDLIDPQGAPYGTMSQAASHGMRHIVPPEQVLRTSQLISDIPFVAASRALIG